MRSIARINCCGAVALVAIVAAPLPGLANDSAAELSIGGLVFTKSADVSMESEDLRITLDTISVRYQFLNHSATPVTLTVAFPLPDIDLADADNLAIPVADAANFVGFETKVDGKPIEFKIMQRAVVGDKDVTALLREAKLPLLPSDDLQERIDALPQAASAKLVEQGVLIQIGTAERNKPIYGPGWKVKTSVVRQQTFPPNKPVTVEHSYKTSRGGTVDTVLRKAVRQDKAMAQEFERYRKDYCVTDAFLASLDKLAGTGDSNPANVQERRISYVLKTGANWAGPIKQFRLTVDSGKPGRLVSFCAPSQKTISPTATEVELKNFTPTRDLKILIVGQF